MRKQMKPISGNLGQTKTHQKRANNLQLAFQNQMNSTFVIEDKDGNPGEDPRAHSAIPRPRELPSPATPPTGKTNKDSLAAAKTNRSPAVSKRAKTKWELLDRKVS